MFSDPLVLEPEWLGLLPLEGALSRRAPGTAVLGVEERGRPVMVDLRNPATGHLLVAAPRAWGASTLLRSLLVSACWNAGPGELGVAAIDLSERELGLVEALPHSIASLARDVVSAIEVLSWLEQERARRAAGRGRQAMLLLVVDDLEWMLEPDQAQALGNLRRLLRFGAPDGIHLAAGATPQALAALAGDPTGSGALLFRPAPRGLRGEGPTRGVFLAGAGGPSTAFQAAALSAADMNEAVRRLRDRPGAADQPTPRQGRTWGAEMALSEENWAEASALREGW